MMSSETAEVARDIALGKYAVPVLGAYGATILLLVLLALVTWARSRSVRRRLERAEKERQNG